MKKSEFVAKTYTPQETLEVIKMWVWNHKIRILSYFKFCVKSKNKNSKHDSKFQCKKSFKNGLVLYGSLQLLKLHCKGDGNGKCLLTQHFQLDYLPWHICKTTTFSLSSYFNFCKPYSILNFYSFKYFWC